MERTCYGPKFRLGHVISLQSSREVSLPMPDGPTVRRRRLGAELRRLREAHSRKLDEVAGELGLVASTLSRIETGKAPIRTSYLNRLLDMYEVTDSGARQVLVDMGREGHRKGWWAEYDDVLPSGFSNYVGLEAEATGLRSYDATLIHGLLQTEDYATAVLRELCPKDTDEQVRKMVDLRMQRQRILENDPPIEFWLILDEGAIRRRVGGAAVMRRQLEHLVEASHWPNVTLQILGFESGAHAGMDGVFSILEFPDRTDRAVACKDGGYFGIVYLEKDREVRVFTEAFDRLRAAALSPAASIHVIERVAEELR
jgi:transcriptional regulator with XRE-family HTH domain